MFENIIKKIESAEKIAIFTHTRPDGDALGSSFGLKSALLEMGKEAVVCLESIFVPTKEYKFISCKKNSSLTKEDCDLWIALDCASVDRLGEFSADFESFSNTVAIDHHRTHVDFASIDYVDADAPATAEIICLLLKEMGRSMSIGTASDLYLGIMTDTGNFKYSSTTARTHRIAGELIELGVDPNQIYKSVYETKTKDFIMFQANALSKAKFSNDNKIAYTTIYKKDLEIYKSSEDFTEGLVERLRVIDEVEVSFLIKEIDSRLSKVSMRSKNIDVAEICTNFGGGGHTYAAGCVIKASVENAAKILISLIEEKLCKNI